VNRKRAGIADVQLVHLSRTFRKFLGCTPGEYLRAYGVSPARYRRLTLAASGRRAFTAR